MPQEPNIYALWFGKQSAKGVENTTPTHRVIQVGGDLAINRDDGQEAWSDLNKYGGQTDWINTLTGSGTPAIEATASELGALLWVAHGAETAVAGTDNVQTLTAGTATGGTFDLLIYNGTTTITVAAVAWNVTSAALDTAIEAALAAAGYAATQVTAAGGPLNTTPITVTFNGTQTAKRPWATMTTTTTSLTGGTGPAITQTTPGVRAKHTFIPQATQGHWCTFCKRIGSSVIQRQSFIDCLVGGFTIEGSTANKAVRITPNILSLDPGKVLATDPAAALPTGIDAKPFLYTEASGLFVMDGTTIQGQSSFTFTVNEDRGPVYGDDVVAYDLAVGQPTVAISITLIFDSVGLARWNNLVYGSTAPVAGTKPLRTIPGLGSYSWDYKQKDGQGTLTGNRFVGTVPGVRWAIPPAPGPNPQGGNTEITLAGGMRPLGGAIQPYTLDVYNADTVAYTV